MDGRAEDLRDLRLKVLLKRWRFFRRLTIIAWIGSYPLCVGVGFLLQVSEIVWFFGGLGVVVAVLAWATGLNARPLRTMRHFHAGSFALMKFRGRRMSVLSGIIIGAYLALFVTVSSGSFVAHLWSNSGDGGELNVVTLAGALFALIVLLLSALCPILVIISDACSLQVDAVFRREFNAREFLGRVQMAEESGGAILQVLDRQANGQRWRCRVSVARNSGGRYELSEVVGMGIWRSGGFDALPDKHLSRYLLEVDRTKYVYSLISVRLYFDYLAAWSLAAENQRIADMGEMRDPEFPWFGVAVANV